MKILPLLIATALLGVQAPADPLDSEVYIYDGGSIYHAKDCIAMTGRVHIRPVKLRELGKGFEGDPFCHVIQRPADAPDGPIKPAYIDVFTSPLRQTLPPARSLTTSTTEQTLKAKCAADWPGDFRMQAYCIDQQREAVSKLATRAMTTPDQQTIRTKCSGDWPGDYRMQNYCEEQQLAALARIK